MGLTPRHSGKVAAREHHTPDARILRRIEPFFAIGEVTGGPLLIATVAALLIVNSRLGAGFERFWDTPLALSHGSWTIRRGTAEWVNDALMPLFFLIIGTEVKREFVKGSLASLKTALFPVAGAIGGIIVPVLLFLAINRDADTRHAWGVVVSMDTAFSLAIVAMFTTRLPAAVRAVLLAFAAIDDLFGLLVIAIAYTAALDPRPLLLAILAYGTILGLLRLRWASTIPYVLLGMLVWVGIFGSGVHATIAGVAIGLLLPTTSRLSERRFANRVQKPVDELKEAQRALEKTDDDAVAAEHQEVAQRRLGYIHEMAAATDEAAERLVRILTPWVSYVILPLFALSHVRIHLSGDLIAEALRSPLTLGIIAGLAIGKPAGFLAATWLVTTLRVARLPDGVSWRMVLGIGGVAGIGFTLSLFIAELALSDVHVIELAGMGILIASLASGMFGLVVLWSAAMTQPEGQGRDPDQESGVP